MVVTEGLLSELASVPEGMTIGAPPNPHAPCSASQALYSSVKYRSRIFLNSVEL
jgi:hypothetical protein